MPRKAKPWTANQRKFQLWLALGTAFREPKTQEEFAAEINVNPVTLSRWKKWSGLDDSGNEETFQRAVNRYSREMLADDLPEAFAALRERVKEGSYQHLKMYFEMLGEYVERQIHDTPDGKPLPIQIVEVEKSRE